MNLSILKNPGTRVILELLHKYEGKEGFKKVQKALNNIGKNIEEDGIIGNITINAIKSVSNTILHKELEKILLKKEIKTIKSPLWIKYAKEELGTKEILGKGSSKRVLQYHAVSGGYSSDAVPWCGSFVNFIMVKAGYKGPRYPARAKAWLDFGKSSSIPIYGSIAVKSRKGGGHVTFVIGEDVSGEYIYGLGGNQNDSVNISKYKKSDFLDFRVPLNYDYVDIDLPLYTGKSNDAGKED